MVEEIHTKSKSESMKRRYLEVGDFDDKRNHSRPTNIFVRA